MHYKSILAASILAALGVSTAFAALPFQVMVPVNPGVTLVPLSDPVDDGLDQGAGDEDALNSWSLSAQALPEAEVGTEYSFDFSTLLVTDPVGYALDNLVWSGGSLPAWLVVDPDTGEVVGTPDAAGDVSFTITASHSEEGNRSRSYTLVVNGVEINVVKVSAGGSHVCAITTNGAAMCWGSNANGQLGNPDAVGFSATPVVVAGLDSGVTEISVGGYHTCAIHSGVAKCWGDGSYGQLGHGASTGSATPVAVNGLGAGVTALDAGSYHSCAIQNGAAKCWGENWQAKLGDGTSTNRPSPAQVQGLDSGVTAISAGASHTCAIQNGAAKCWGAGTNGRLGHGSTNVAVTPADVIGLDSGVVDISASGNTCALLSGGSVMCWGNGNNGRLGPGVSSNINHTPIAMAGLASGVTQISSGSTHTCVIQNGAAKCWGDNTNGRIGDGVYTSGSTPNPATVGGTTSGLMSGVTSISAGGAHACAVQNGKAFCWGSAASGMLGNGETTGSQPKPQEVQF